MASNTLLRASVILSAGDAGEDGAQDGDDAIVLVDGSESTITASGLAGYIPTPGDRLLVTRVGSVVEVVQFLERGTVPYLGPTDLTDIQAQIDSNTQGISDTQDLIGTVSDTAASTQGQLDTYQATNDAAVSGLQASYDPLTGLGQAGVEEDYFWVGDDPALSTVKLVAISAFVQSALYAGDYSTLSALLSLWNKDDIGDVTFATVGIEPPMSTFYDAFVAAGLEALPWNA